MTVVVDRYVLGALLGRCAGGRVHHATDLKLQRPVAITIVPPAAAERTGTTVRRAHAAAARSHPGRVTVLDAGDTAEGAFVVTERLDGGTLADRLTDGPLAHADVVALLDGVLAALAGLHEHGHAVGGFAPWQVRLGVEGMWALAVLPAWNGDATPLPLAGPLPADAEPADLPLHAGADLAAAGLAGIAALTGHARLQHPTHARAALRTLGADPLQPVLADAVAAADAPPAAGAAAELRRRLPGGAPAGLPATVALPAPTARARVPAHSTPAQRLRRVARALTAGAWR